MKLIASVLSLFILLASGIYAGDKCVNCASGGPCQQCRLDGGIDNAANRKKCEQLGCKIVGTSSCSKAANVKVCN